jgi:phosphomannomutase
MIQFGTGGFRGVIGDDFTKENVQLVAQGLSDIALADHSVKPIIIGFDNRFMSDFAARWFAEVLAGNGLRVFLYTSPVPTPAVMSATRDMHHDYGVMVTASHNPYYFNGIKLFLSQGFDADVAFTTRLEQAVKQVKAVKTLSIDNAKKQWIIQDFSNTNIYLTHIKRFISPKIRNNHAKIIYDNMCGVGVVGLEPLSQELGIHQFDIVHAEHDAFFSFNLPNPTEAMLSGDFRDKVLEGHYDCGLATDSDGDRLGIIDEKGNYVSNNEILASLYYYLVKYKDMKGDIVKNCATSILVDKVATKLGFHCHEADVGFKNITAMMKDTNALIGGESSGGLTVRGYLFGKDSVFSSALFMEMIILLDKPVSEIIAEVKKFADYHYSFLEDSLAFTTEAQSLIDYIDKHPPVFSRKLVRYDHFTRNFKFYFDNDCWLLIRLSGTEPTFRIFAEMETDQEAVKCVRELKDYLEQVELIIGGGK